MIGSGSGGEAGFVIVVLAVLFFALYRGWYTPEVVVFLSLLAVWNVGIISTAEALSGFSNPGVLAIGALFVVVASIESSRLADKAAKRVFGLTTSFRSGFLRLLLCGASMSAFCNNTPILALLIPVAKDWARTRGYDHAVLLMPLAFACAFGGLLTTVGGGTNLVIQGLLFEAEKEDETVGPFRLFEPGYIGLPLTLAGMGYLLVAAPRLLAASPPVGAGDGVVPGLRDRSGELLTEVEITEDFKLVGRPFALVLATLGLPADTLVKVRRRRLTGDAAEGGTSLPPLKSGISNGVHNNGGGVDDSNGEPGAFKGGSEESKGSSWPGRIDETKVGGGGGRGPFARRRRTAYRLLENNEDGGEERTATRGSRAAIGSSIEMATLRRAERVVDDAAWEGSGAPARETVGGSDAQQHPGREARDELCEVPPDAAVRVGDVLVLSAVRDVMVYALGSVFSGRRAGLKVLGVDTLKQAPRPGSAFFELVLSRSSEFLGRTASLDNGFFSARYGCSVVAFRLRGSAGGGGELTGSGGGGGGGSGSGSSSGGNRSGEGIELLETSAACGTPTAGAGAGAGAATAAVGAVGGGIVGEVLVTGGDDPPLVGGGGGDGGRSLDMTSPAPYVPFFPGDESPTTTAPFRPPPGEPSFESERRYPRHRRRRRKGEAFEAGDVVVVVATERFSERCSSTTTPTGEFLRKRLVGRLPEPTGWFHCFPLGIFALMLAWVLLGEVDMIRAVFAACGVLLLGGWVDAKQAVGHVNWGLLLLIGSALGFSKAMANSGLADLAGTAVRESGMSVSASLYALFGLTMLCTELISNNAAAALNIPVALSMARELEADYKPFAMTVLVAASCSFLTPIGTPTNTLVWAPGGYKFQDYAKLGAPLTLLFWVTACAVIPRLFPF